MSDLPLTSFAETHGLDLSWLAGLVAEQGPAVLTVIEDALKSGLTPGVLVEIVKEVGVVGLEVFTHLAGGKVLRTGVTPQGTLPPLVKLLLQQLLAKYGPALLRELEALVAAS